MFACEQVKEFAPGEIRRLFRLAPAIVAWLAENFFMGHRPGHAGNRYRQDKQPDLLECDHHSFYFDASALQKAGIVESKLLS